jgi:hypothetical protein
LLICSRCHRLLQDDLAALEVARDMRAHRVLADVRRTVLVHVTAATWGMRQAFLAREVDRLARSASLRASSPKSNSSFQLRISSS